VAEIVHRLEVTRQPAARLEQRAVIGGVRVRMADQAPEQAGLQIGHRIRRPMLRAMQVAQ